MSGIRPPIHSQLADSSRSRSAMASDRAIAIPTASRPSRLDRQLGREHRPPVLGERELDERVLVVPAEELAVRLPEPVADGRREVDPADQRERRIQDERDRDVEAADAVEPEVPGADAVAVRPVARAEPELVQPALDVGRAHRRPRPGSRHGGQSTVGRGSEPSAASRAPRPRLEAASRPGRCPRRSIAPAVPCRCRCACRPGPPGSPRPRPPARPPDASPPPGALRRSGAWPPRPRRRS